MKIITEQSLAHLTTFRIGGKARFFCSVESREALQESVAFAQKEKVPILILGGGSNVLVSDKGFNGLVIKVDLKGIKVLDPLADTSFVGTPQPTGEDVSESFAKDSRTRREKASIRGSKNDFIFIRVEAGENWDDFVRWTVDRDYGGLENLSLIPGSVGGAPVQNIGAYGVEVGNFIESVEVFDLKKGVFETFKKGDCGFSYRDSLFKRVPGRYVIVTVLFKLKKDSTPDISYKDLSHHFRMSDSNKLGIPVRESGGRLQPLSPTKAHVPQGKRLEGKTKEPSADGKPSLSQVREAVIAIRTAKLPDTKKVGTAGSFFKNPILSKEKFDELRASYPELPSFPESDGRFKIPLAWIIDQVCGLKGKKFGKAGIHDTQALVIVNYGNASFDDVEKTAHEIENAVKDKTGIDIEREVIMI